MDAFVLLGVSKFTSLMAGLFGMVRVTRRIKRRRYCICGNFLESVCEVASHTAGMTGQVGVFYSFCGSIRRGQDDTLGGVDARSCRRVGRATCASRCLCLNVRRRK